ncbi:MAG: hypothetical protein LBO82_03490 [Synergistaceae bacterium]|nr:hypothetical protein [Synergistaceae bacterium]
MPGSAGSARDAPDPFAAVRGELEPLRLQFETMMREKRAEFENLKEYTLWQLNSMSDRTVEIAREKAGNVDILLARDLEKAESELAEWRERLSWRIHDEKFLGRLAREAAEALLPRESGEGTPAGTSEGTS